ncbi:hypothetical protein E4U16_005999 [Claviceps sp. LM84 group G4]|nr:hypothetical protein E4U16_005999 [Claviceps sp. LM84 group G4]
MASPAASRYGVDNNNNNYSAIAAVFAEPRATAAASPWARRKREHQSSETTLCFFARVIANYCDRPPQQRQLPAFTGPQSRQQAPLHNFQSHHQAHAPWSIDNRPHEQYHGGQGSAPNWPSSQPHAQPLTTAASISGPQLGAPGTPIDLDADHSFRFPIPARQYSWAGSSMLYESINSQ